MQFNLVNDQEQVALFVWRLVRRGMALHCMVLALGFISILGGVPVACIIFVWCFSMASLGNTIGQRLLCTLCVRLGACPRGFPWLSLRCVGARVLSGISSSSCPYSGE